MAVEKVAEQHIARKYFKCNSLRVISHIITLGKSASTHSKVGKISPNQKNFEERKNSLGQVIYQICVTVVVSEKTVTHARMHGRTHMLQIIISRRRVGREIISCNLKHISLMNRFL